MAVILLTVINIRPMGWAVPPGVSARLTRRRMTRSSQIGRPSMG